MLTNVNKKEIRYIFTTLAKSYGVFFALNLVLSLAGVIEILSIADLIVIGIILLVVIFILVRKYA